MLAKNLLEIEKLLETNPQVYYTHLLLTQDVYVVPIVDNCRKMSRHNFEEDLKELYRGILPFEDLVLVLWKDEEGNVFGGAGIPFVRLKDAVEEVIKLGNKFIYIDGVRVKTPGPQTTGTSSQKNAYVSQAVEKFLNSLNK